MPSDAEIAAYAGQLPGIYRDTLAAFPAVIPHRAAGSELAFQTRAMHFANTDRGYGLGEVQEARRQLEKEGVFRINNGIFASPTEIGEQLIAAVSGRPRAPEFSLPPLPARPW